MAQHNSNNPDITKRLEFFEIDGDTQASMARIKHVIAKALPQALDRFYAKAGQTPDVARFFRNKEHMSAAKNAQMGHWQSVGAAVFDDNFVSHGKTIGETHARIGLEPRWYIGGYALILEGLIAAVVSDLWPKGYFMSKGTSKEDAGKIIGGLVKSALLDMDFAISVYVEAAEKAKQKAQEEAIGGERALVRQSIGAALERLANRDLSHRLMEEMPEAYVELANNFNDAVSTLENTVQRINGNIDMIRSGTQEIAAASGDLAKRAENHAIQVEETMGSLLQLTTSEKKQTDTSNPEEASVIENAIAAMKQIEGSSKKIAQIIGVMDEIAFQTNLLALNAGVEAARAGDSGRGFAVVATEVRALAQRSGEAAREIRNLISESTGFVAKGSKLVSEAGEAIKKFGGVMDKIDQTTQQNAAMAEESTAACHNLAQQADDLQQLMKQFKISG